MTFLSRRPSRTAVLAFGAVVLVVAAVAAGWGLAGMFESPAQREAAAKPPAPGPVTATVTSGDLSQVVTARAVFSRASKQTVPLNTGGSRAVVTAVVVPSGRVLTAGRVALEINGRPLFAIPGQFPLYRDLVSGASGPDVKELQEGLRAAGYEVAADGRFGPETSRAVLAMYADAGYVAPSSPADAPSPSSGDDKSEASSGEPSDETSSVLTIPQAELVVVASLPATVASTSSLGDVLGDDSTLVLEHGAVVATASVAPSVSTQLRKGMSATVRTKQGEDIRTTVGGIATAKAGDNASVSLLPVSGSLPATLLGTQGVATITIERAAEDSMLVPASAIVSGGTGQSYVLKEQGDSFVKVSVTEIATLAGRSAIRCSDALLKAGDRVKVG